MNELPVLIFLVRAFFGAAFVFLANVYSFLFTNGPENSFADYTLYRADPHGHNLIISTIKKRKLLHFIFSTSTVKWHFATYPH